jgi:hypothetical protein
MMLTATYLCACAGILWCCMCRLAALHGDALPVVRLAFYLLGVSGAAGIFAVAAWGYVPRWVDTYMALAIALVQVATSRLWRSGVPTQYMRESTSTTTPT